MDTTQQQTEPPEYTEEELEAIRQAADKVLAIVFGEESEQTSKKRQ